MLKTDSIKAFLEQYTLPDLAELYDAEMEVQVNVARDDGEVIRDGRSVSYTDAAGVEEWKSFRIPFKANSEPEYQDSHLKFDLGRHADGIGMSGWNWKRRQSMWVGFDFDAIVGHSEKHDNKLSSEQLMAIRVALEELPYVTIRASTGGRGLHVYVFLHGVRTETHTEHAALARAILDKMALEASIDLKNSVDVCGAILWVWHRKFRRENGGLGLLKSGCKLDAVPQNWRDHLAVVSGKKSKSKPVFITDGKTEELFDILSSHRHRIPLDEQHKSLIQYLVENGHFMEYKCDHNMLITHTSGFLAAYKALGFRGVFKTISKGEEQFDQNCFAFPMKDGVWVIRRFTRGTAEEDTWDRDDKGWTRCYFNRRPDFRLACIANHADEVKEGGFLFPHATEAQIALEQLGLAVSIQAKYAVRSCNLKELRDGRLCLSMKQEPGDDTTDMKGWVLKKGIWERVIQKPFVEFEEADSVDHDNVVRSMVSQNNNVGWALNTANKWIMQPQANVSIYLKSLGMGPDEVSKVMGNSISKYWTIVNKPFQPEYPGEREWNRDSARLRVTPTSNGDSLNYDHWSKVLRHLGNSLDASLKADNWAQLNNVCTGEDYLKLWIASLIKQPDQQLPYLFFFGPEDAGKSVFAEAISLLIDNGVMKADNALSGKSDHNGELEHSVLCYLEEADISKSKAILNKLKDYVTAKQILLHVKYLTPHMVPNTMHWVQFANHIGYCPVFPGDTRIVVLEVPAIDPIDMIPKKQLIASLEAEASDFLRCLLDLEIPPTTSRLNIPVIKTEAKTTLMDMNESPLALFIQSTLHRVPGKLLSMDAFYTRFLASLDVLERPNWTRDAVVKAMPGIFPTGRNTKDDGKRYIINASFDRSDTAGDPFVIIDGWIRMAGGAT